MRWRIRWTWISSILRGRIGSIVMMLIFGAGLVGLQQRRGEAWILGYVVRA
jgi:hypothetical protein